jgi:sugar lactone lactonase YvrE
MWMVACSQPVDSGIDATMCTQTCGGGCVDVMTDAHNCGTCGHTCGCGSTSCTAGSCDAHVLAAKQGDNGNAPLALGLHNDTLYWANGVDGTLSTMSVTGGSRTSLYPGRMQLRGFAFDATRIYFTNAFSDLVESGALDGTSSGSFTNHTEFRPAGIASDGQAVYWTASQNSTVGTGLIRTKPVGPPSPTDGTTIADGRVLPDGIAVDATSVYWTEDVDGGAIMKVSKAGGTPVPLAIGQGRPHGIAVADGFVYWANQGFVNSGSVQRVPVDGGTITTFAAQQDSYSVAVDASYVYWTSLGTNSVMRAPLAGGPAVPVVAGGLVGPLGLAISSTCLYVTDLAGSVFSHDLD